MNVRDALTTKRRGQALHRTTEQAMPRTLCGHLVISAEPEQPGTRAAWRALTANLRTCHRCDLALEGMAEGDRVG